LFAFPSLNLKFCAAAPAQSNDFGERSSSKMSARNYPNEMMAGINQLKEMRDNISSQIDAEKTIYDKLKEEITVLSDRL
jgi:hypothetical protein